ncbi:Fc.00g007270.m01.CDS01 [Cosmosporella sp. VM-42]
MPQSLKAVAEGGTISAVGILTGAADTRPQMTVGLSLINRNAALKGINIGPRDRVEEMLAVYTSNQVHPIVDRVFGFDEVKAALNYVKDGSHFGKVVVRMARR